MGKVKVVHDDASMEIKKAKRLFSSASGISLPMPRIIIGELAFDGKYSTLEKDAITIDPTRIGGDGAKLARLAGQLVGEYAIHNIEALNAKQQSCLPVGLSEQEHAVLQAGLRESVSLLFENIYITREINNTYSRTLSIIRRIDKLGFDSIFDAQNLRKHISVGAGAISHSINYMNDPKIEIAAAAAVLALAHKNTFTSDALRFLVRPANEVIGDIAGMPCGIDGKLDELRALANRKIA